MKVLQYILELQNTLLICTIFAVFWYVWMFIKSRKSPTKLPPGPTALPLVGNLLSLEPELHTYFTKLARTYGHIFKLKLGNKLAIVVNSPSTAREVLKDLDTTFANRDVPVVGRELTYGGLDITWTPYGPEWRMLRKVCVLKMLSNTTLESLYELRRSEMRQMVSYIYSHAGSPINIGEQMFLTILNVITNMLWGGSIEGDERAKVGAEFRRVISEITEILGAINISDLYPALARFDLQGLEKRIKESGSELDRIFEGVIDKRLKLDRDESETKSTDFLEFLLKVKDEQDPKTPLTMTHIKALLMDMVVGGTDTSANTIEFTMAEILNKPEVMKRIQEELDTVLGQGNIVEEAHTHKLSFLQAVVKESLRLYPVLPLLVPHCPSETSIVGGYTIPKGSRVFINVWAIHRDPTIWENPTEFIPERFLNAQVDYSGQDFNYIPFGSGRRMCAGLAMAERMLLLAIATLLHSFNWKLPQGQNLDLSEKFGIVLKLKAPLVAIAVPRFHDQELYK